MKYLFYLCYTTHDEVETDGETVGRLRQGPWDEREEDVTVFVGTERDSGWELTPTIEGV